MQFRSYLSAVAKSDNTIEFYVHKSFSNSPLQHFRLYEDHHFVMNLSPVSQSESNSSNIYTLLLMNFTFVPGREYEVATDHNFFVPIDISYLAKTPEFEKKYRYDGALGAIYSKEKTTFRVFSPFASQITLRIKRDGKKEAESYSMERDWDSGIFFYMVEGNLDKAAYLYEVRIFGISLQVVDPYAYALDSNSRCGYVINPKKVKAIPLHEEKLPPFSDPSSAILYECHVRDMTSLTDYPDKGTFESLSVPGRTTKEGNPVGLDYLASLEVSHIQLLPVLDYQTVDEDHPFSSYNWGYDPEFYFAPEGSLCLDPNDPYCRVIALRKLIASLHERGMRVTLDVVYNHVFSQDYNALSILVPNYYFRFNADGSLSNGTGCGNDFESRNYMARKLIIDSLLHCLDFFGCDGFRFDLMGILDVDTLNLAYQKTTKAKKNILFYGEGWDMMTNLPADQKGSYPNAEKLPHIGFFNDRFRDVVKGKSNSSELNVRGYLLGDTNYRDGFKHVLMGSSLALAFAPMFSDYRQSVNYVECHDNNTLYDKIKIACREDSEEEIEKRIKMIDVAVLMSCGIPFFHAGQELGATKNGKGNTYNSGDEDNGFSYDLLDQRKNLYLFFRDAVMLKKKFIELAKEDYLNVNERISFEDLDKGALKVNYTLKDFTLYLIFNPSKETLLYTFEDYVKLVFTDTGSVMDNGFYVKMAIINALSVQAFLKVSPDTKLSLEDTHA